MSQYRVNIDELEDNLYFDYCFSNFEESYHEVCDALNEFKKECALTAFEESGLFFKSSRKKSQESNPSKPVENNVFAKIGEFVKRSAQFLKEIMERFMNIFRQFRFKNKTDMQKLGIILKSNPELKDQIIDEFKKGNIDLKDVKSLNEFSDQYVNIIEKMKNNQLSAEGGLSMWQKAKQKLERADSSKVLGGIVKVGAAITAITAIFKLGSEVNKFAASMRQRIERENKTLGGLANENKIPMAPAIPKRQPKEKDDDWNKRLEAYKSALASYNKQVGTMAKRGILDTAFRITNEKNKYTGRQTTFYGRIIRILNQIIKNHTDKRLAKGKSFKSEKRAARYLQDLEIRARSSMKNSTRY